MARGKCPNCNQLITELVIDAHIHAKVHPGNTFACINFLCPNCSTVVGTQMDPNPVKNQTINALVQKLRPAG